MRVLHLPAPSTTIRKGFLHASTWLLAVALIGCAGSPHPTASPSPNPTASPSPAAAFPVTLTDDEGTAITLVTEPESIVSLTPANTELVFALGAGDRLRGGTDFDDFPPQAVALPDVATFSGVLIEQVVQLEPDLVLAGGNNFTPPGDIDRLRELGLNVLVVYAPTVDAVLDDITLIGTAIGAEQEATAMVNAMSVRIDSVTSAVEGLDRPRVFYEIGNVPQIFGPAPESFVADMVELAGGDPITTTDPAVFSIPLERLVDQDPQIIILGDAAYGVCPDQVPSRPGWQSMTAVREGQIRPVDDIIVTRPGPRLAEGLAALALAIHPEANVTPTEAGTAHCATPTPSSSVAPTQ
jgi:iron complex transport system substrate-binding protein